MDPGPLSRTTEHVDAQWLPLLRSSPLFERLRASVTSIHLRTPNTGDETRWLERTLGGRRLRFGQPLTFTPYASSRACSACCRFCSENLRRVERGTVASKLRPSGAYFERLSRTLAALGDLPLSWSLSGLENTDDAAWLLQLLTTLEESERRGLPVHERVLYSNGAGFAHDTGERIAEALQEFGLSWLELSRHHDDDEVNQSIMRFRAGESIASNAVFADVARRMASRVPLKMVCIVQQGGVAHVDDVARYLDWAETCGASTVVFREFSRLGEGYRPNPTQRYLTSTRVAVDRLLGACLDDQSLASRMTPVSLTEGYYFWNLTLATSRGTQVVFETSDYAAMHRRHESGAVYKLVYFANGRLCSGWDPERDVLLDFPDE